MGAKKLGIVAFVLVSATAFAARAQTLCQTPADCPSNRVCIDGRCDFPPLKAESARTGSSYAHSAPLRPSRAPEEATLRKAEPIPTAPTPFDVGVNMAAHLGGQGDTDPTPQNYPPTYVRNSFSVRGTLGYRLLATNWSSLFMTTEIGIISYRYEDANGSGGKSAGLAVLAPTLRIPLKKNFERWGYVPSDRIAVEVSAGGYLAFGAMRELGAIVRAEIQFAWFRVGGGFTYGSETGFQPMFVWGVRFGF